VMPHPHVRVAVHQRHRTPQPNPPRHPIQARTQPVHRRPTPSGHRPRRRGPATRGRHPMGLPHSRGPRQFRWRKGGPAGRAVPRRPEQPMTSPYRPIVAQERCAVASSAEEPQRHRGYISTHRGADRQCSIAPPCRRMPLRAGEPAFGGEPAVAPALWRPDVQQPGRDGQRLTCQENPSAAS
jgi:hypothetical protein